MKNWTEGNMPIITEQAKEALSLLIDHIDFRQLDIGLRNLTLAYIRQEQDRENWFNDMLLQLPILYAFIDGLEEEYTKK
jgi:hypothetical protein